MFTLTTSKGRRTFAAVVVLAFTVGGGCIQPDGEGEIVVTDEQDQLDGEGANEDVCTGDECDDLLVEECTGDECDEPLEEECDGGVCEGEGDGSLLIVPDPIKLIFGACHDTNAAGGASDGWIYFLFGTSIPSDAVLTADVTMQDGVSDTFSLTPLGDDGASATVPLDSFGQQVNLEGATFNGEPIPLDGFETTFTVDPANDCTYHEDFYSAP